MGWWAATKRTAKRAGRALKGASGEIARDAAVAGAAIGAGALCTPVGLTAPCAIAAGAATDKLLGDTIERTTRRVIDKTGQAADDFISSLRSSGGVGTPPPGMATEIQGQALETRIVGELEVDRPFPYLVFLSAGTVVAATLTLIALRRAGRI